MAGKPSLAIVIGGHPAGGDEEHDAAADELAEAIGVPEEKRDAFRDALRAYVDVCVSEAMKSDEAPDSEEY